MLEKYAVIFFSFSFLFFFEAGYCKSFRNMRPGVSVLVHWSIDSSISWSVGNAFLDPLTLLTRSLSEAQNIDCNESISWFFRLVIDVSARSTIPSIFQLKRPGTQRRLPDLVHLGPPVVVS